jgi:hypothetical protein
MKRNKFKCDICGETFTKGRSDEEALAETYQVLGGPPAKNEELGIVCVVCWEQFIDWWERIGKHEHGLQRPN